MTPQAARLQAFVLHGFDAAKLRPRAAPRLRRRHPDADQILRVSVEVKAHLLFQRVLEAITKTHVITKELSCENMTSS